MKFLPRACAAGAPLVALLLACGAPDPLQRSIAERARWNVTLLNWAMAQDGSIALSARVSGPVQSRLERLTVRIVFEDAGGATIDREWRTLDLSGVQRGGPQDLLLRLAPRPADVQGIGIDLVPAPDPDEIPYIVELERR